MAPSSFLPQRFYPIILSSLGTVFHVRVYRFLSSVPKIPQSFPLQKHLVKHHNLLFSVFVLSHVVTLQNSGIFYLTIHSRSGSYFLVLISWKHFTQVIRAFDLALWTTLWLSIWMLIIIWPQFQPLRVDWSLKDRNHFCFCFFNWFPSNPSEKGK